MKRCLILQGGGLRGAFAAGACFALADLHISQFEMAFAVSASVPTLAYFLTGQNKEGREVWENYLSTKKLIRYLNLFLGWKSDHLHRPIIDLYYLVYQVFRDRFPLKVDRLMESPTKAFFVAIDAEKCLPHYFQPEPESIYNVMRACMALPVAVPETPLVDGQRYGDGGIIDPLPVEKAIEMGSDRLLVIMTIPAGQGTGKLSVFEKLLAKQYFADNPALLDLCLEKDHPLERSIGVLTRLSEEHPDKVVIIRPPVRPPAGRVTRNRRKIMETLKMGYDELMINREKVERLMHA